jgi:hypothetical protein
LLLVFLSGGSLLLLLEGSIEELNICSDRVVKFQGFGKSS